MTDPEIDAGTTIQDLVLLIVYNIHVPSKIDLRPHAQLYILRFLQFEIVIEIQSVIEYAVHIHRLVNPSTNTVCKGSAGKGILRQVERVVQEEACLVQHIVFVQP
jgi:hypothetical protein